VLTGTDIDRAFLLARTTVTRRAAGGTAIRRRRVGHRGCMTSTDEQGTPVVVVTGANGLVGSATCAALAQSGATVRAVVRRAGAAPDLAGVEEHVGDFFDPALARAVVAGADAVVTTVHPMGADRATQHRIGVEGTSVLAEAARAAGVSRLVHISTAGVYDRSPGVGDVDEDSPLVLDDANDYAVTKRDTDAALAELDGLTRVLVRPPAILGPGGSSVWNTLRPAEMRDDPSARRVNPDKTFAWVHLTDLVQLVVDLATGAIEPAPVSMEGPVDGGCSVVNVAADPATSRSYYETVTSAVGVEPEWVDEPAWTGRIRADRARTWGWKPTVDLGSALAEIRSGLASATTD
jgi:2-alkyl-3-oxoalkanoate reductase